MTEMLYKTQVEEQTSRVDERLSKVVKIIVEQYDGDVKAFVETMRYRIDVDRKVPASSGRSNSRRRRFEH
jgi:hypothetical protein